MRHYDKSTDIALQQRCEKHSSAIKAGALLNNPYSLPQTEMKKTDLSPIQSANYAACNGAQFLIVIPKVSRETAYTGILMCPLISPYLSKMLRIVMSKSVLLQ